MGTKIKQPAAALLHPIAAGKVQATLSQHSVRQDPLSICKTLEKSLQALTRLTFFGSNHGFNKHLRSLKQLFRQQGEIASEKLSGAAASTNKPLVKREVQDISTHLSCWTQEAYG